MGSSDSEDSKETQVPPKKETARARSRKGAGPKKRPLTKITPNHRRFADFLVIHKYDHIQAYIDAYGCSRENAVSNSHKLLIDPLFMAYRDSIQMPMLESIDADKAWLTQQLYNMARSNVMHYFEYRENADGDELRLKRLDRLAEWKQQNIKKIKIRNRFVGHGDDRERIQEIEFELYDRSAHIHKLALAMGIYSDLDKNDSEMVERLVAAEARNLTWAHDERVRRLGTGVMKEVDGVLIEHDGDPTI